MNTPKYNWKKIYKESAAIITASIANDKKPVSSVTQVYERLKAKYHEESRDAQLPKPTMYRKMLHKKLNLKPNQRLVKSALYQMVGAYDKMNIPMLANYLTISSSETADNSKWLFIRLQESEFSHTDVNKLLYNLSQKLKKKFSDEILFISFDIDTIVMMCKDYEAKDKIVDYFHKSYINVIFV